MTTHDATIWLDVRPALKYLSNGNDLVVVAMHARMPEAKAPTGVRRIAVTLKVPTSHFAWSQHVTAEVPADDSPDVKATA